MKSKLIKDKKPQLDNTNAYSYKNRLSLSKKLEIFKNIYKNRFDKTEELSKSFIIMT